MQREKQECMLQKIKPYKAEKEISTLMLGFLDQQSGGFALLYLGFSY